MGCAQIPGVPQLYVHSTGISLEIPTEAQRQEAVRARLPACLHPACAHQLCVLNPHPPASAQAQRSVIPAHERAALNIDVSASSAAAIHTNVRFKRNKAKGPNPLSMKKRKRVEPTQPKEQGQQRGGGKPAAAAAAGEVRLASLAILASTGLTRCGSLRLRASPHSGSASGGRGATVRPMPRRND